MAIVPNKDNTIPVDRKCAHVIKSGEAKGEIDILKNLPQIPRPSTPEARSRSIGISSIEGTSPSSTILVNSPFSSPILRSTSRTSVNSSSSCGDRSTLLCVQKGEDASVTAETRVTICSATNPDPIATRVRHHVQKELEQVLADFAISEWIRNVTPGALFSVTPPASSRSISSISDFSDESSQTSVESKKDSNRSEDGYEDLELYHKSILQLCLENPVLKISRDTKTRIEPIFCCKPSNSRIQHDWSWPNSNILKIALKDDDIPRRKMWQEADAQLITYMIQLIPNTPFSTTVKPVAQKSHRYIVYISSVDQSFEITAAIFEQLIDGTMERISSARYSCAEHRKTWTLVPFVRREKVRTDIRKEVGFLGGGLSFTALSIHEIAKERRKARLQHTTYGRKDEVEEIIGRKFGSCEDVMKMLEENDYRPVKLGLSAMLH